MVTKVTKLASTVNGVNWPKTYSIVGQPRTRCPRANPGLFFVYFCSFHAQILQ